MHYVHTHPLLPFRTWSFTIFVMEVAAGSVTFELTCIEGKQLWASHTSDKLHPITKSLKACAVSEKPDATCFLTGVLLWFVGSHIVERMEI